MDEIISSGRELSIYDRRRDKDRRRVIKGARTIDNRNEVVESREKIHSFLKGAKQEGKTQGAPLFWESKQYAPSSTDRV